MGRSHFDVHLAADGTGTVSLNGTKVDGVNAIRIDGSRNQTPVVTLQVVADVHVDGVGEIAAPGADPDLDALDRVLAAIDPSILDRAVLDGLGLGDGGSTGEAYLTEIRRFVRGD